MVGPTSLARRAVDQEADVRSAPSVTENEDDDPFGSLYYPCVLPRCHQSPSDGCTEGLLLLVNRSLAAGVFNLVYQICDWQARPKTSSVGGILNRFQSSNGDFMFDFTISREIREAHCHE